jgi:hypothetical protein
VCVEGEVEKIGIAKATPRREKSAEGKRRQHRKGGD